MTKTTKAVTTVGCLSASFIASIMAGAQSHAAVTDDSELQLQEIVVTAQKRTENVMNVPINIAVLGGAELQSQQITNLEDLSRAVPDLALTNHGTGVQGSSDFAIRGIASSGAGSGASLGQRTVGVYLDDVGLSTPTGAYAGATSLQIFDINRIEVLRGPQGTLYGASAMGGTIRYVTNAPDLTKYTADVLGTVSWTKHGEANYEGQLIGNAPLIDNELGLRIGLMANYNSGYITNQDLYTGNSTEHANHEQTFVGRAVLKWVTNDNTLTVEPSVLYQRYHTPLGSYYDPTTDYVYPHYLESEPTTDTTVVPSLTISKDFGWADATSITSYFDRKNENVVDFTLLGEILAFGVVYPTPQYGKETIKQVSEEFRLVSKTQSQSGLPFDWIAGVYYSNNQSEQAGYYVPQNTQEFQQLLIDTYGQAGADEFGVLPFGSNLYTQIEDLYVRQLSAFGELNYTIVPKLTATFGIRYLVADMHASNLSSGYESGSDTDVTYSLVTRDHATTPKVALKYEYTEGSQVYANAVKGFRLGGANQPIPNSPDNITGAACLADLMALGRTEGPPSYGPDSVWSYEIGDKSSLFNRRVTLDASIYHITWNGVQQDVTLPSEMCGYDYVDNVGHAKSDGADLYINAQVTEGLNAYVSGSVTHAVITDAAAGTGAYNGAWLQGVPRWEAGIGGTYTQILHDTKIAYTLNGHWIGQAHQFYDPTEVGYLQPQTFLMDGTIAFNFSRTRISFFAQNLLDSKQYFQQSRFIGPGYVVGPRPLTLGLTAEYKF
jgi:outer membrane receptor protein involved in Fe transport